jgi:quinolinate synthase
MSNVNPRNLLGVLEGLEEGEVGQAVQVRREVAGGARAALDRMLEVT